MSALKSRIESKEIKDEKMKMERKKKSEWRATKTRVRMVSNCEYFGGFDDDFFCGVGSKLI